MCGRFVQKSERKIIAEEFYVQEFLDPVVSSYNVAPGQEAGIILQSGGANRYARFRWGLVPAWAKDPGIGNRMINARSETITEKPSYRQAFRRRRCLVSVDGFYEWKKDGKVKVPFFIYQSSGAPFSLAGLWEVWNDRGENPLHTFTILTTEANARLKALHDRMPVVIPPDRRASWLDGTPDSGLESAPDSSHDERVRALLDLLRPAEESLLDFHEVSRFVNSPQNNTPDCIALVTG